MLTYYLWACMVFDSWEIELFNVFAGVCFSPITFILDILLSPIEIITLIVWKILNKRKKY